VFDPTDRLQSGTDSRVVQLSDLYHTILTYVEFDTGEQEHLPVR
jgi:hypothetical protein